MNTIEGRKIQGVEVPVYADSGLIVEGEESCEWFKKRALERRKEFLESMKSQTSGDFFGSWEDWERDSKLIGSPTPFVRQRDEEAEKFKNVRLAHVCGKKNILVWENGIPLSDSEKNRFDKLILCERIVFSSDPEQKELRDYTKRLISKTRKSNIADCFSNWINSESGIVLFFILLLFLFVDLMNN